MNILLVGIGISLIKLLPFVDEFILDILLEDISEEIENPGGAIVIVGSVHCFIEFVIIPSIVLICNVLYYKFVNIIKSNKRLDL